jgi:hypothetical protein
MPQVNLPPSITINKEQAEAFLIAIAKVLVSLPLDTLRQVHLFQNKAVVISYSSDYQPFIGFKLSYNYPDDRLVTTHHESKVPKKG